MSWIEENKGLVATVVVIAGVAYFTGGAMTARRHRGAISASQMRFKEQFKAVKRAFADLKAADKALKRVQGHGWLAGKILGDPKEKALEQKWARERLATEVRKLRAFESEWATTDRGGVISKRVPYFITSFENFKHKLAKANPLAYSESFPGEAA